MNEAAPTLYVDLDGTLVRTDITVESVLGWVRRRPRNLFRALWAARRGRPWLKELAAADSDLDPAVLPYNQAVLEHLRRARDQGRRIVLATASNRRLAERVADHLGLFDEVLASGAGHNVKGRAKLEAIRAHCGDTGFDYLGDAHADLPIWQAAGRAQVVRPAPGVMARLQALGIPVEVVDPAAPHARHALRAMRPHQWLKNLLLFVPLVLAQKLLEPGAWAAVAVGFVAFSLCASGLYLFNDVLDLDADRRHPRKRLRAIAGGDLPLPQALVLGTALPAAAVLLGLALSPAFVGWLLVYALISALYSVYLKRLALVDVLAIAGLFMVRVLAGTAAIGVGVSFWLLAVAVFIFFSLALIKRYTELRLVSDDGGRVPGRGYLAADRDLLVMMGVASGYAAVIVVALYIDSDDVVQAYGHPERLWFVCPLVFYWISRMWIKAHRGEMHDDPLLFALRDRPSLLTGVLLLGVMAVAAL